MPTAMNDLHHDLRSATGDPSVGLNLRGTFAIVIGVPLSRKFTRNPNGAPEVNNRGFWWDRVTE
jgi:hypothetical protein